VANVTIHYQCDDVANTHGDVVLAATGGTSTPITGIDQGTDCVVTETTSIPNVTPTYSPVDPTDDTQGLATIPADSSVTVTVTNHYPTPSTPTTPSTPQVQPTEVAGEVVVAAPAAAVVVAPAFTG
jgi:hypothetical protein